MRTLIYLNEVKPENLIATVDLEVVPRGIYHIEGKPYQYVGQPNFFIEKGKFRGEPHKLTHVELVVEEYLHVVEVPSSV